MPSEEVFHPSVLLAGAIVGLGAGLLIVPFNYVLARAESWRGVVYHICGREPAVIFCWFAALISVAFCLRFIVRREPMSSGSGIPQIKEVLQGRYQFAWPRLIAAKFAGVVLAIGSGLSLGRAGPSVQLGAAVGQGVGGALGRHVPAGAEKHLIAGGAGAGLAVAFNAPLAGVVFSLEEFHENFSPAACMTSVAASFTANFVALELLGQKPLFHFAGLPVLPLSHFVYLIGLGLIGGCFGALFNRLIFQVVALNRRQRRLPQFWLTAIPLLAGGVLGLYLPETLGSGNHLVDAAGAGSYPLQMLVIILAVKFLFTVVSYGTGVPGGLFLPMLVLGALTGAVYGNAVISFLPECRQYYGDFVVFAMAAFLAAIVKAPVTGCILITEMTGSIHHLIAALTVAVTAYLVSDLLKTVPIYAMPAGAARPAAGRVTARDGG